MLIHKQILKCESGSKGFHEENRIPQKGPSPNIVPTSARIPDTSYTDRQLWCPRQSPFALCVTVVASMLWLVWLAVSSPISLIFIDEVICLGHFANTRPPLFTMLMLSSPNMYIQHSHKWCSLSLLLLKRHANFLQIADPFFANCRPI